jgi:hypothetical protein
MQIRNLSRGLLLPTQSFRNSRDFVGEFRDRTLDRLRLRGPNGSRDEFLPRSHRPKPPEAGETDTGAEHPANLREQSRVAPPNAPTIALDPTRLPPDLFNRIGHEPTLHAWSEMNEAANRGGLLIVKSFGGVAISTMTLPGAVQSK